MNLTFQILCQANSNAAKVQTVGSGEIHIKQKRSEAITLDLKYINRLVAIDSKKKT